MFRIGLIMASVLALGCPEQRPTGETSPEAEPLPNGMFRVELDGVTAQHTALGAVRVGLFRLDFEELRDVLIFDSAVDATIMQSVDGFELPTPEADEALYVFGSYIDVDGDGNLSLSDRLLGMADTELLAWYSDTAARPAGAPSGFSLARLYDGGSLGFEPMPEEYAPSVPSNLWFDAATLPLSLDQPMPDLTIGLQSYATAHVVEARLLDDATELELDLPSHDELGDGYVPWTVIVWDDLDGDGQCDEPEDLDTVSEDPVAYGDQYVHYVSPGSYAEALYYEQYLGSPLPVGWHLFDEEAMGFVTVEGGVRVEP